MEDDLISSVYRKIEREKVLITAARSMRQSTDNASVQQSLDSNIRESQKNIGYLEDRMRELQSRRMKAVSGGMENLSMSGQGEGGPPPPPPKDASAEDYYRGGDERGYGGASGAGFAAGPRPAFAQQA